MTEPTIEKCSECDKRSTALLPLANAYATFWQPRCDEHGWQHVGATGSGKTTLADALAAGTAYLIPGRDVPPLPDLTPSPIIHSERVKVTERYVAEGITTYCAWEHGYELAGDPRDDNNLDGKRCPVQGLLDRVGTGTHVRVTVEVLD